VSKPADIPTRPAIDLLGALKSAALTAVVAFGLFSLLIGVRTDQGPSGALELTPRLGALGVIVAIAFVGGFVRALLAGEPIDFAGRVPLELKAAAALVGRYFGFALLAFAIAEPILFITTVISSTSASRCSLT
jgi:branched-chain amino acid transport system permease protein